MGIFIPEGATMTEERPSLETILETWLTTAEAAEVIERNNNRTITTGGVRDLCQRGTLRAIQISGQWYIDPEDAEYYRSSRRGPRPQNVD